jgi:hypothetical protein
MTAHAMDNSITKPFKPAQWTEMFLPLAANEPLPVQSDETKAAKMESPLQVEIFEGTATLLQVAVYLRRTTNLKAEQIERVFVAARKSLADTLAKAAVALVDRDFSGLGRAPHTLKGTLLQCGLDRLAVKAEEILHGTRSNRDLPHERLLGQLRVSLTALLESETDPAGGSSKEDANG